MTQLTAAALPTFSPGNIMSVSTCCEKEVLVQYDALLKDTGWLEKVDDLFLPGSYSWGSSGNLGQEMLTCSRFPSAAATLSRVDSLMSSA
jgi:hypothetical protein